MYHTVRGFLWFSTTLKAKAGMDPSFSTDLKLKSFPKNDDAETLFELKWTNKDQSINRLLKQVSPVKFRLIVRDLSCVLVRRHSWREPRASRMSSEVACICRFTPSCSQGLKRDHYSRSR